MRTYRLVCFVLFIVFTPSRLTFACLDIFQVWTGAGFGAVAVSIGYLLVTLVGTVIILIKVILLISHFSSLFSSLFSRLAYCQYFVWLSKEPNPSSRVKRAKHKTIALICMNISFVPTL